MSVILEKEDMGDAPKELEDDKDSKCSKNNLICFQ